jgi:hypothetical protein
MTADRWFIVHSDGRVSFHFSDFATGGAFDVQIYCPIASELHGEQRLLEERHRAWARKFDLMPDNDRFERYAATHFDELIGYQYHGWPLDAATVASHLMTWFFVFDDNMDIDHNLDSAGKQYTFRLAQRHLELLDGGGLLRDDASVVVAFDDFLRQVRNLAGERWSSWYRRMVHHLKEYVYGTIWESAVGPTTAARANTAMYMQVRHMAVGVAPCHDLMAIAARIDPTPIVDDFFVRRLERLAINYSIWINDLAGLNRDQKRGLANVIFTIQKDHSLSLEEAARMVGRLCDDELKAFFQMEQQMPTLLQGSWAQHRADLVAYDDVLRRWMRGLLDWSARSDRYQRLNVDMSLQSEATIREAARRQLPQGLPS